MDAQPPFFSSTERPPKSRAHTYAPPRKTRTDEWYHSLGIPVGGSANPYSYTLARRGDAAVEGDEGSTASASASASSAALGAVLFLATCSNQSLASLRSLGAAPPAPASRSTSDETTSTQATMVNPVIDLGDELAGGDTPYSPDHPSAQMSAHDPSVAPFLDFDLDAVLPPVSASRPASPPRRRRSSAPSSRSRTSARTATGFMPSLGGLARTISIGSLGNVTLKNILDGETCDPISFSDFEGFLSHKEFTTENLLFIVWFRSYAERFFALPDADKAKVAQPSGKLVDQWNPFGYLVEGGEGGANGTVDLGATDAQITGHRQFRVCEWTQDGRVVCSCTDPAHRHIKGRGTAGATEKAQPALDLPAPMFNPTFSFGSTPTAPPPPDNDSMTHLKSSLAGESTDAIPLETLERAAPTNKLLSGPGLANMFRRSSLAAIFGAQPDPTTPPPARAESSKTRPVIPEYTPAVAPALQPMRQEAQRAFATFLRKGGSKELNINDDMRQACAKALAGSTHPQVFRPVYEEIYSMVERQSLPHFLSYAQANVNLPKQLFWYAVGLIDLGISLLIYLVITFMLNRHSVGQRAWRLWSLPFACFGAMQTYSAWRGFCTQVWGRASRQVHPWEMDEDEADATPSAPVEALAAQEKTSRSSRQTDSFGRIDEDAVSAPSTPTSAAPMFAGLTRRYGSTDVKAKPLPQASDVFPISDAAVPPAAVPLRPTQQLMQGFRRRRAPRPAAYKRPPIFGPERLILDDRVVRLHKQVVRDILIIGAIWTVVWLVLCLAVPLAGK